MTDKEITAKMVKIDELEINELNGEKWEDLFEQLSPEGKLPFLRDLWPTNVFIYWDVDQEEFVVEDSLHSAGWELHNSLSPEQKRLILNDHDASIFFSQIDRLSVSDKNLATAIHKYGEKADDRLMSFSKIKRKRWRKVYPNT